MCVLVTGGAGYIGSHAVRQLLLAGHKVVVVDNLSRAYRAAVLPEADFVQADVADKARITHILREYRVECVMHFAAFSDVGESVAHPELYSRNNVAATARLLDAMQTAGVRRMVFSSSCVTYGIPDELPVTESATQRPINPYGETKLVVERMLRARAAADPQFAFVALRYFNAAGCARDGSLGEDRDPQTRLIPIALQVALGQRDSLVVFGDDYDTADGTCVRDYVHVDDIARAHVQVMDLLWEGTSRFYNLGLGRGYSVRETLESVRHVTGRDIAVRYGDRRPGDAPELFADSSLIRREVGWQPEVTDLDETVATAWRWFRAHPAGYRGKAAAGADRQRSAAN